MASEPGVHDKLSFVVGLRELEEHNLGRKIVDIRKPKRHEALVELVHDGLPRVSAMVEEVNKV
jgi:hypothetical protein